MSKHEYIDYPKFIDNVTVQKIIQNALSNSLVTEKDVVKPILEKLLLDVSSINVTVPVLSKDHSKYVDLPKRAQEIKDEVISLINDLLDE